MPSLGTLDGKRLGDVLDLSRLVIRDELIKYDNPASIELKATMFGATQGQPPYNRIVLGGEVERLDDEEFLVLLAHELTHFLQYDRAGTGHMPEEFRALIPNPEGLHVLRSDEREAIAWEARQAKSLGWTPERYQAFVSKLYPDPERTISFFNPPEKMMKIPREIETRVKLGQVYVHGHRRRA